MKIQWFNHIKLDKMSNKNGFGYATERIVDSLTSLGHVVKDEKFNADVFFAFDQPHHVEKWPEHTYNIIYFPWESSKLMSSWYDVVNSADEVWTPSPIIANWLKRDGITPPIHVFEHGVDPIWSPKERKVEDRVKFLNLGFESARKFGPQTIETWRQAFIDRTDAQLTVKMQMSGVNLGQLGKITYQNDQIPIQELVSLFHNHHVFYFLSAGEGFGLPGLQAAATGMPVITNPSWAPYADLLDEDLGVKSKYPWFSSWQDIHPGAMMRPHFDQVAEKLHLVTENYDYFHQRALARVPEITARYDWLKLTDDAFKSLEKRL